MKHRDGKPFMHRRLTAAEDYRSCHINPATKTENVVRPLAQGPRAQVEPISKIRLETALKSLDAKLLCEKLIRLKKEMDKPEKADKFSRSLSDKLSLAQPRPLPVEDDDQSILDKHVSRVFSPIISPGTVSPKHLQRNHHRSNEMSTSMPDFGMHIKSDFIILYKVDLEFNFIRNFNSIAPQGMRHSKSIPEHASSTSFNTTTKKLSHKWPSTNIDSGISLCSGVLPYKTKEMKSR